MQGLGFSVWGLGFRVQVAGFRVQGAGCRVRTRYAPGSVGFTNPSHLISAIGVDSCGGGGVHSKRGAGGHN